MNILELLSKAHPQVRIERRDENGGWEPVHDGKALITKVTQERDSVWDRLLRSRAQHHVRGVRLEPGTRLVVREAARYWPTYPRGKGEFYARSLAKQPSTVRLTWQEEGRIVGESLVHARAKLSTVRPPVTSSSWADLVVEIPADSRAPAFLGVHRLLDRNVLIARCKGRGLEIGPGPKPQILPGPGVDVSYVEQATPEEWLRLYGKDTKMPVDPALWNRYVVGNADKVPAQPGTLDFIFSSHVIEHLANPLGHLRYWGTLLRRGGLVAAVIPDLEGCKDFVFEPSSAEELLQEYRQGDMAVKLRHYERWAVHRAPGRDPAEIMASGRSIHVHFYTPDSMRRVLSACRRELGFRRCEVISSPNHKDFYVLLEK